MKKDKRDAMINLEPRGQCFFWGGLPLCSNKFELSDFKKENIDIERALSVADKGHPKDWLRKNDKGIPSLSVHSFLMGSKAIPCKAWNRRCLFVIRAFWGRCKVQATLGGNSLGAFLVAWWWGILSCCEPNGEEKACGAHEVMKVLRRVFGEWGQDLCASNEAPTQCHTDKPSPPHESNVPDINMRWMVWHLSISLFFFVSNYFLLAPREAGSNTVWRVLRKWGLRDELQSWHSWSLTCDGRSRKES